MMMTLKYYMIMSIIYVQYIYIYIYYNCMPHIMPSVL